MAARSEKLCNIKKRKVGTMLIEGGISISLAFGSRGGVVPKDFFLHI